MPAVALRPGVVKLAATAMAAAAPIAAGLILATWTAPAAILFFAAAVAISAVAAKRASFGAAQLTPLR